MVMRKHQRYFPLYKPATQDLLPHFITVANGPIDIPTVKVGCLLFLPFTAVHLLAMSPTGTGCPLLCHSQAPVALPCFQKASNAPHSACHSCPIHFQRPNPGGTDLADDW